MAYAPVQSAQKAVLSVGSSTTLAFPSDVTAGNLLVVAITAYRLPTTIQTPTDTRSTSYAAWDVQRSPDGNTAVRGYAGVASSSGANTVTVSLNGTGYITVVIAEFSGAAASPFDTGTGGTGTGTAASSGNVTPSEDNCLLVAALVHDGSDRTLTEEAGWTRLEELEGGSTYMPIGTAYKVQTTATTEDADWTIGTGGVDWAATIGVFKAAAAAGANPKGVFGLALDGPLRRVVL